MIAQDLLPALQGINSEVTARQSVDWPSFLCPIGSLLPVMRTLRDNHGYDMLVDATAMEVRGVITELTRISSRFITLVTTCHSSSSIGG